MTEVRAYWATAPGSGDILKHPLANPRLKTLFSGISRGTESLVAKGLVPEGLWQTMRCPHQEGDFPFPVKYGYQSVQTDGDKTYFSLFPHQTHSDLDDDQLVELPAGIPARRAVMAANMETALNAIWDSGAGPGDRINVIGIGVVGALVAYLASRLPGTEVTLTDLLGSRAKIAEAFGVSFSKRPPGEADLSFHCSGSPQGLQPALASLAMEGKLVDLSWYGGKAAELALGEDFHVKRLQILASQVGQVAPSRRPRWSHRRRLQKALQLLDDPVLDLLIDREIDFDELPHYMAELASNPKPGLLTLVNYR